MLRCTAPVLLLFLAAISPCSALEPGGSLPQTAVTETGELFLNGDDVNYRSWRSDSLHRHSPALIFHMAARLSSEQIIAPLKEALEAADYPPGSFQSVSIVNLKDALWGTRGLVLAKLADNKREHPQASLIADKHGGVLVDWQLTGKGVAVILLSADGDIRYFSEGEISQGEVTAIITLLNAEIARSQGR